MIRLIAIDMDGTLLNSNHDISHENKEAIEFAMSKGVKVVLCTGRTLNGVTPYLSEFAFTSEDFLILQNGVQTVNLPNLDIVAQNKLQGDAKVEIAQFVAQFESQGVQLNAYDKEHIYLVSAWPPSEYSLYDASVLHSTIEDITQHHYTDELDINKSIVIGPEHVMDQMMAAMPKSITSKAAVVRSQPIIIEFLPKGKSKATGLAALAKQLDIAPEDVMSMGDQLNDLEMIQWAGIGVAMGNSIERIQREADFVTKTNDESGVAHAIYTYIK